MTTYEQREFAGISPVAQQALPAESKHTLDDRRDEARLHRIEAKGLRLLDNPMIEYKQGEITETLWNPRDKIMEQLKSWKYQNISLEEANHIPFRYAS